MSSYWIGILTGYISGFLTCLVCWGYSVISKRDGQMEKEQPCQKEQKKIIGALFILAVFTISLMIIISQAAFIFESIETIKLQEEIIINSKKIETNLKRDIGSHAQVIKMHQEEMKKRGIECQHPKNPKPVEITAEVRE